MRVIAKRVKDGFLIPFIEELKQVQIDQIEVEVFLEKSFTDRLRKTIMEFPEAKIEFGNCLKYSTLVK